MKTTIDTSQLTMTSSSQHPTYSIPAEKHRELQIELIYEEIGKARERNKEFEGLVKGLEERIVNKNIENEEVEQVLGKVKSIVQIMNLLCKFFLNKTEESNHHLDHSILKSYLFQQEFKNKPKEIHKRSATIDNCKIFYSQPKNEDHNQSFFAINSSYKTEKNFQEYETPNLFNEKILPCEQTACSKNKMEKLGTSNQMILSNEHFGEGKSINWKREWKELEDENVFLAKMNSQSANSSGKKFQSCHVVGMQAQPAHCFMKRYKSIMKICLNSLNLLTKVYELPKTSEKAAMDFCLKMRCFINEIAENFNLKYHSLSHIYDDEFCRETKEKVKFIYESMYTEWKFKNI